MNMIEQVARAIITARYPLKGWEGTERWDHKDAEHEAICVIKAMREPTEKMMGYPGMDNYQRTQMTREWHEMIDAALSEGE